MKKYIWIYFSAFVTTALFTSAVHQPRGEACIPGFSKLGCYHDSQMKGTTLLISDRNGKGVVFDWKNFAKSIHSLVCRCQEAARTKGYNLISIRYWAECWASKLSEFDKWFISSKTRADPDKCVNQDFEHCLDADKHKCVGKAYYGYVYLYNPIPTWGTWAAWTKCPRYCGPDVVRLIRMRQCSVEGSCKGKSGQRRTCPTQECAKAKWSQWEAWPACKPSCSLKFEMWRNRTCVGAVGTCPGDDTQYKTCEKKKCKDKVTIITEPPYPWSGWTQCSKTCGKGMRRRTAYCTEDVQIYDFEFICKNHKIKNFPTDCNLGECPTS